MVRDRKKLRPELAGRLTKQRFEQEVAEEIGLSLDRRFGRGGRKARDEAAGPGAPGGSKDRPEEGPSRG